MLCTFATNYFTTQAGANFTCPADRSASYSNTINLVTITDYRFWDTANGYEYPFCDIKSNVEVPGFALNLLTGCDT